MIIESVDHYHEPVYLAGRYVKLVRDLSQTPWEVRGKRLASYSVSEAIGDQAQRLFGASGYKFMASGREDVDVRMLGSGRPFLLEIHRPTFLQINQQLLDNLAHDISKSNQVNALQLAMVHAKAGQYIKEGEETKSKTYRCVVWVENEPSKEDIEKVNDMKNIQLEQNTPIRVCHRRAIQKRSKMIHEIKVQKLSSNYLIVHLTAQAGTYIKEFIHGDLGRTIPSFGDILSTRAEILELDVLEIHLEWPSSSLTISLL